jgi:hypothetical protein
MSGRDRAAAGEETVGKPAKAKHLKGPSMDRECTRLGDALSVPLQDRDLHLRQRELADELEPDRATANDNDVKFLVHGEYSYSAVMPR